MSSLFRINYSCRVELSQDLPDNTHVKSLEDLTADFKRTLDGLFSEIEVTISDDSVKTSVPFD